MAERNALSDLSERLKSRIEHHGYAFDSHKQDDIKAQRIVEELAWACDNGNEGRPWMDVAQQTIMRCREIAEKGAEDERSAK